jgi:guanylate kinase
MHNIYVLTGKSASGKDAIFRILLEKLSHLRRVVMYTTRPMRSGEVDGDDYFFVDMARFDALRNAGKIIEWRSYPTVHGDWHYFTVDDGQIDLSQHDYLIVSTLDGVSMLRSRYGAEQLKPCYIYCDPGEQLMRALKREKQQETPLYAEMCRRFLADESDFSDERLQGFGIEHRFKNDDIGACVEQIAEYIASWT